MIWGDIAQHVQDNSTNLNQPKRSIRFFIMDLFLDYCSNAILFSSLNQPFRSFVESIKFEINKLNLSKVFILSFYWWMHLNY